VPAGTPVAEPAALVSVDELVRPFGRLLLTPIVVPLPFVVPWQF
jgi:hypothetical protein